MLHSRRKVMGAMGAASMGLLLPSPLIAASRMFLAETTPTSPDFEPVRARIRQAIAQGGATGVAIAVASRGRIVVEEGFGWANREAGLKVTAHTPFSMASITKPFTATTLMTLAAEGKINLDAPANRYLAASRIHGTARDPEALTVRMLGAHVSGLPGIFASYEQGEAKLAPSPETLLRNYGRLAYPPGTCYEYSNIGFSALDAIASKLTSTELSTLMQQRLLAPLRLNDSFFDTEVGRLGSAASRYDPSGHRIPYYTTSTPASGELYASAHDLARFAMFTVKHRFHDQKQILEDRWIDELLKPVFVGPSGVATTFGWFAGRLKSGVPIIFKSGGQPGVATILYMVPSIDLACLVLTNQSNAGEMAREVCSQLVQSYLPEWQQPQEYSGYPPAPFVATSQFQGRWAGSLENDSANMPAHLDIESSNTATFSLGLNAAEPITDLHLEGEAFTGNTKGSIDSPDVRRTEAVTLGIKLLAHDGKLLGRVFATAGDPEVKNVRLPYVLTLDRVSS